MNATPCDVACTPVPPSSMRHVSWRTLTLGRHAWLAQGQVVTDQLVCGVHTVLGQCLCATLGCNASWARQRGAEGEGGQPRQLWVTEHNARTLADRASNNTAILSCATVPGNSS
jgi:hypothetical protein